MIHEDLSSATPGRKKPRKQKSACSPPITRRFSRHEFLRFVRPGGFVHSFFQTVDTSPCVTVVARQKSEKNIWVYITHGKRRRTSWRRSLSLLPVHVVLQFHLYWTVPRGLILVVVFILRYLCNRRKSRAMKMVPLFVRRLTEIGEISRGKRGRFFRRRQNVNAIQHAV